MAGTLRRLRTRGGLCCRASVWHPDIVIFGTYQELVQSLSAWTERQWDNVGPRTAEFRFDVRNTIGVGLTVLRDGLRGEFSKEV